EDAYYVIVPLQDEAEGSYGTTSNEAERPYSEDACRFEHVIEECP
ncbi:MAG: hypothetical protein GY722_00145, partial [bacterium]|nr:hypothetical protein [bacterium]